MKNSANIMKGRLIENRINLDKIINNILENGFTPQRAEELFTLQEKHRKLVKENEGR